MSRLKEVLTRFPAWIFTILTVVLILWLTLAPDPLGEDSPELFEGADKIAHAIMFGFLTLMILLDRQRNTGWHMVSPRFAATAAILASLLGILVEFAQYFMGLGRGFEVFDMVADVAGAALCAFLWTRLQPRWSSGR